MMPWGRRRKSSAAPADPSSSAVPSGDPDDSLSPLIQQGANACGVVSSSSSNWPILSAAADLPSMRRSNRPPSSTPPAAALQASANRVQRPSSRDTAQQVPQPIPAEASDLDLVSSNRSAPNDSLWINQGTAGAPDLDSSWPTLSAALVISSLCRSKRRPSSTLPPQPAAAPQAQQLSSRAMAQQASQHIPKAAPPTRAIPDDKHSAQPGPSTYPEDAMHQHALWESISHEFYRHLRSNAAYYEAQLFGTTGMNNKYATSNPYTIKVSYKEMWKFNNPDFHLMRAMCNSRTDLHCRLLHAAREFVRNFISDNAYAYDETTINGTGLSFIDFPESMQMLKDFRATDHLVQRVHVFKGKSYALAPTFHGRHLMETLLVGILTNHSKRISWDGDFLEENILIIKWQYKGYHETYSYEMKILREPVEGDELSLRKAMVRDLCKAAEIFIPLYKEGSDFPVHFVELKEELEGAKECFVAEDWYREYLRYHPGVMPSTSRCTFLSKLHRALDCNVLRGPKPCAYPDGWTTIVELKTNGNNLEEKGIITVLYGVYKKNKYTNTERDLIRFMRNVSEHGKHPERELELSLAKMFSGFLPAIMRTMLKSGDMENLFGGPWSAYKRLGWSS